MRVRHVHRFVFEDGNMIDFYPSNDHPFYRWQIVVNGQMIDDGIPWAGGSRPNLEMARRFYHRHCAARTEARK